MKLTERHFEREDRTGEAGKRPLRCFFLLPRPVFPVVSGYSNKNYVLIQALAKEYRLHLLIITGKPLSDQEIALYKECGIWVTEALDTFPERLFGLAAAFLKGLPLQVGYYYRSSMQQYINRQFSDAEAAIAGLTRTTEYLYRSDKSLLEEEKKGSLGGADGPDHIEGLVSCMAKRPVLIFDMVDSISSSYERSIAKTKSHWWRMLYRFESKRLKKYERRMIHHFDVTFFVNQAEEEQYRPYGRTKWLPHGVKPELLSYTGFDEKYQDSVAFIGKMNYQPNVDAVVWYIENVHSRIGDRVPLIVVGAYPAKILERLAQKYPNIAITGYCEDPYLYLHSALAVIAPMQSGGGIQNKVLEAMALGKVTLLTPLAAEAISGAADGRHFLVLDKPEDYAGTILDMLSDRDPYKEIGENARRLIQDCYTWDHYCGGYMDTLHKLLEDGQK